MKVECPQWSDCGVKGGGCCALGKFGGRPSRGTCHLICLGLSAPAPEPPPPRADARTDHLRSMWAELHRAALAGPLAPEWLEGFARRVPCGACKTHWREILDAAPPDPADPFAWSVRAHNAVNRRLGKAELSVDEARGQWAVVTSRPAETRTAGACRPGC